MNGAASIAEQFAKLREAPPVSSGLVTRRFASSSGHDTQHHVVFTWPSRARRNSLSTGNFTTLD